MAPVISVNTIHAVSPASGDKADKNYEILVQGDTLSAKPAQPCPECTDYDDPECSCMPFKKRLELFNNAHVPAVFLTATLDKLWYDDDAEPSMKRAALWITQWAQRDPLPRRGILLSGFYGTGKSFAMAALARFLTLERGVSCLFVDFGQLLMNLKARFKGKNSEVQLYESLKIPHVLIIDDAGSGRESEWAREVLKTVIAFRYNACARTFITTNLLITSPRSPGAFERFTGPHCASRLAEMCYWLQLNGPDRRRYSYPTKK
jgi:DNA replication protein DnaC